MNTKQHRTLVAALVAGLAASGVAHADKGSRGVDSPARWESPTQADAATAQQAVEAARQTLAAFLADPQQQWLQQHLGDAHALLVVPKMVRAGFGFIGGSGGRGVLLARNADTGWSMPAFYMLGGASVGLEVGVQRLEAILVATTQAGVEALANGKLQLGIGVSIAAGPVGQGMQAASADVLVFERAMGLYGGLTLEGAAILADNPRNRAYYGQSVDPDRILREGAVQNAGAQGLLDDVTRAAGG